MKALKAEPPMTDIPHTQKQYERQKGPIPPAAIFLAIGLILALAAFYFPVFLATVERAINK